MAQPLGTFVTRTWEANPGAYGGRRSRVGGHYRAFVPKQISKLDFNLDGQAVAAVSAASKALAELSSSTPRVASLKAIAGNLVRSESAASSRIEGLRISQQRLARAAFVGEARSDNTAAEILGNVEAMTHAIEVGASGLAFSVESLVEVHRRLLRFSSDRRIAGKVRNRQNWIGGNEFNPLEAVYVPPPYEMVQALLEDLCSSVDRDDIAPVVQAAVAHAQFENIHPFADGNGRVGRALIYLILRRRNEIGEYVPPISLVLGSEPQTYIGGLGAFSRGDLSGWCEIFALATERAAREAERLAEAIESLQEEWLIRLGSPRSDSAAKQLVSSLPEQPVLDVAVGQALTGKSHVAVQKALQSLQDAGILSPLSEKKFGRVWECRELFDLVDDFEQQAAQPDRQSQA